MNIVFLCRYFWPHVGGVEGQVIELSRRLINQGHQVTVITTKHDDGLADREIFNKISIIRFKPLKNKYFGLLSIWRWMLRNRQIFTQAEIIHAHSVLIWYWPLKLFLNKPVFVTFHGWEGIYPIPFKNILIRRIDAMMARKNITIHDYVSKWYGIKADEIMYTAVDLPKPNLVKKDAKRLVYVGRLDEDTGLPKILSALTLIKNIQVDWCGDGPLAEQCRQFGRVHGWVDPRPYYARAAICLSPGVTSILEAFSYRCLVVTTYNNPVKKDYLLMTPFRNWLVVKNQPSALAEAITQAIKSPEKFKTKIDAAINWVKTQNHEQAVKLYLRLWQQ